MKGRTGGLNTAMKKVGRNMARANQQKASPKVQGYAAGGGVSMGMKVPKAKDMGSLGGSGMDQSGFGSGNARGGKSSRGKKFSGTF